MTFMASFRKSFNLVFNYNKSINMRKLIWKLYNDNMISEEVAHMLLDKYYE